MAETNANRAVAETDTRVETVLSGDPRNQRPKRTSQTWRRSADERHRCDLVGWRTVQNGRRYLQHVEHVGLTPKRSRLRLHR